MTHLKTRLNSTNPPYTHVSLVIETFNEHARGILRGIRAFAGAKKTWVIHFRGMGDDLDNISWLRNWRGDGLITRVTSQNVAAIVGACGVPTVDLIADRFVPDLPYVEADNHAVAQAAADHLLERGFKHFGFLGDSAFLWSRSRETHFRTHIEASGLASSTLNIAHHQGKLPLSSLQEEITSWLEVLPKPVGIMTSSDVSGRILLETCRLAGFNVPLDVAVIGVDNDTLLCELADPPLSSVALDAFGTGFLAASLLQQLMDGETLEQRSYLLKPLGVATRPSTDVYITSDAHVQKALRFMRAHACDDIKVADLLKVVPLSRRALEARFVRVTGKTPHEEIVALKLKRIKELLLEPSLSLLAIAELTGFKHTEYLSVFFKHHTGLSPSVYRSSYPDPLR